MQLVVTLIFVGIAVGQLAYGPLSDSTGRKPGVVGALSLLISIAGGGLIGQAHDATVLPLVAGFGVLGFAALAAMRWTESGLEPHSQ